jgi:3-deoxy-D-manno-octulosonic-acid transferase
VTDILGFAYAIAAPVAAGVARLASVLPGDGKLLRSMRARRGLLPRYAAWGASSRLPGRQLLWVHAPSVGEGLQARPVLEQMRQRHPSLQLAYTYFSPSAEPFGRTLRTEGLADFVDYLPWDTPREVSRALDALAPTVLVFAKLDVWPMLVHVAAKRHVRLALVSATLSASSRRRSPIGAAVLRRAYAQLDVVGAIGAEDARRLSGLGVRESALRITGDTRYDQVWARAQRVDRTAPPVGPLMSPRRSTLVAGSTWPPDEHVVLTGWSRLRAQFPALRLVVAPHEPTASRLASLEQWASDKRCRCVRLTTGDVSTADLVLVDRVGILGTLYAAADVAFVGGGFHGAGLHSVIEPAAFGAPVVFGPRYASSPDAPGLLDARAAHTVRDAATFVAVVEEWLAHDATRRQAGDRARQFVESGRGATDRTVAMIEELGINP